MYSAKISKKRVISVEHIRAATSEGSSGRSPEGR